MANTLELGNGKWATGKDTVLAFNDENNNFKPLPFSFSRASSATVVNKDGLIETVGSGEPRIDFKDNTKGALLLEPSRSNLIPRSEDIDTGWSKLNVTVANNQTVSPDGTLNAALSTVNSSNSQHASYDTLSSSVTSGQPYYISCFVKKYNSKYIRLVEGYTGATLNFNLDDETYNLTNGSSDAIVEAFDNGWYRIGFKFTPTTTNSQFALYINNNSNENSYTGNGEAIYIYGAQLEQGSYATSYIPTSGSAVTRSAESTSQTVPDGIIGQTEGTVYAEIDFANTSGVAGAWSISNGSSANRITMNTTNLSSTQFTLSVAQNYNSGSTKLASANVLFSDKHKVAIKYSGTTLKLFVDGQLADSVSTDGFGNYTNFYVGGNQVGVGGDARKFIQADLYNTALTDQELIALTQ
jgi:hypothetical protein